MSNKKGVYKAQSFYKHFRLGSWIAIRLLNCFVLKVLVLQSNYVHSWELFEGRLFSKVKTQNNRFFTIGRGVETKKFDLYFVFVQKIYDFNLTFFPFQLLWSWDIIVLSAASAGITRHTPYCCQPLCSS